METHDQRSIPTRLGRTILVALGAMAGIYLALGRDGQLPERTVPRIVALLILVPSAAVWVGAGWNLVRLADDAAVGAATPMRASMIRIGRYLLIAAVFLAVVIPFALLMESR